jgi:hypothetical protein
VQSWIAVAALIVSALTASNQIRLARRTARRSEELAIAHSGAQTANVWRTQVLALHDRGLEPDEIRWIMCCEDEGIGHEEGNGIIDEIIGNVPRVPPEGMVRTNASEHRRLPRPRGEMRADRDQRPEYGFKWGHDDDRDHTDGT